MPQFDFANVFWSQLFWLAITFSILYFGVVKLTLPKLGRVMEDRETKVTGDLDQAEEAKASADALEEAHVATLNKARDTARGSVAKAKAEAAKAIDKKVKAADKRAEAKLTKAQAAIDTARNKALGQIEAVAAENASEIVTKLTGAKPSAATVKKAAKAALAG